MLSIDGAAELHLTFDDGPDPIWTPAVLAKLAEAGATATFFVLGERVREHPLLISRILAGGHAVGLHGEAHLDHSTASADALVADTAAGLDALAGCGVRPDLWRLPWGRRGLATAGIAALHGLQIVGWDADTHDWRGDGWDDQPESVRRSVQHGGTVLLHDAIGPGAPRGACANTLELVRELAAGAASHGTPLTAVPGTGVGADRAA